MRKTTARLAGARERQDRLIGATLFVVLGGLAYSSAAGITCSNDGSTYALVRSLAEQRSVQIDHFAAFTEGIDLALHAGHAFSDRAPGVALLAVPLDLIGRAIGRRPSRPRSRHDNGAPQIPFVLLLPALAAGAASAATYWLGRRLEAAPPAATLGAIAVGAGSLVWKDGAILYRHDPGAALIAIAVLVALGLSSREDESHRRDLAIALLVGLLLGLAALCDPPALVVVLPLAAFAIVRVGRRAPRRLAVLAIGGVAGLAPALIVQLLYDRACFGAALANAYQYSASVRFYGSASAAFSTPLWRGARALLLDALPFGSLASLSPALLVGLGGIGVLAGRRLVAELVLVAGGALAILALVSKHATFYGGGDFDYRYLVCAVPLLGALLAMLADALLRQGGRLRIPAFALLVGLVLLSIVRSAEHVRSQYGHRALPGRPLFTNLVNLPLWLISAGLALAFIASGQRLVRAWLVRSVPPAHMIVAAGGTKT